MKSWNLEYKPRGNPVCDFRKLLKKNQDIPDEYTNDVWWRYFSILHMTGSATRIVREEHIANLNSIRDGKYYSKATVNTMEMDYLTQISELKTKLLNALPDDTSFNKAAREVISRTRGQRQNSRSTRPGKINNKTGKREGLKAWD